MSDLCTKKEIDKISFVIPCYLSEFTLETVVMEIQDAMNKLKKYEYEIVLVNDCSPDNTFGVIKRICKLFPNTIGINLAKNVGQHAALMAGLNQSSGELIICLDDDGQTPANEVYKIIDKIEEGYDVVYAKYLNKKHSSFRNFGSFLNSKMTEYLLGKPKELYISSYFGVRRFVVNNMIQYQHSFPYVIGLVLRATENIANVEVLHRERVTGTSGYSLAKLIALWVNGFTAFSIKPLRIATFAGFLFAFLGFIYTICLVIHKLMSPTAILLGWSSTMSVIMIVGGIILIVLGIIGEYIGRIYICINRAPQFIVRDIVRNHTGNSEK